MFLNTSRSVALSFAFATTVSLSGCGTADANKSGDAVNSNGGGSAAGAGSGGLTLVGGSASGTGTAGMLTGGTQNVGGTSNNTGGKSGATGGNGTATTTTVMATGGSGNGGSSAGKSSTGGRAPAGGTSSNGSNTGGAPAGGTQTGGGTGGIATVTGGTGTSTSGKATGGSGNGGTSNAGGATGSSAPAGGTSGTTVNTGGSLAGGTQNAGGTSSSAGTTGTAGASTGGGGSQLSIGACTIGAGTQKGTGETTKQYLGADVQRNDVNYKMITNGWGKGWSSHDIAWLGTSVSIKDYQGSRQSDGAPAGFPTVFCGKYSDTSLACGLPKALTSITALNTTVSWTHAAADGKYNASYDVWLGDGSAAFRGLQSYFMVWLHDPEGEQPAGSLTTEGVTVANVSGKWNIITGTVNSLPIVNYVRAEGDDTHQIAFDIMDFIRDAQTRKFSMPGKDVLAVAFGFEIWSGPVTNLLLDDFCLDIQ